MNANFLTFPVVQDYYENTLKMKHFGETAKERFTDTAAKTNAIMAPFLKYMYENVPRKLYEEKDIVFCNYAGIDMLLDENLNLSWLEYNMAPSNGCLNESRNNGVESNPVFVEFARRAFDLWIELGNDREFYKKKTDFGSWVQISGPNMENPYKKESDILSKLFNLYLLLTTGNSELSPYKEGNNIRYPEIIIMEQLFGLTK